MDVLEIGTVHFPTGKIFACDPMVELWRTLHHSFRPSPRVSPAKICVVPSEKYGDRYACVKVAVSGEKPVRYELGMVGNEDLNVELGEYEYFGFGVDAGMGCIADIQTQAAFKAYSGQAAGGGLGHRPLQRPVLRSFGGRRKAYPKYQESYGNWLNWTVPRIRTAICLSFPPAGGTGYYPVYFGYDAPG